MGRGERGGHCGRLATDRRQDGQRRECSSSVCDSKVSRKLFSAQSKLSGKTITCTEVGYQSRNYAWIRGLNDRELDPQDCSSTPNCVNLLAQARAYEGLIRALYPMDWFDGVYLWLWRTDPTAGGSSDDSYTPQQKPATAVMKALFT